MSLQCAGIRWNSSIKDCLSAARSLGEHLEKQGLRVILSEHDAVFAESKKEEADLRGSDVLFVLGGDGTILSSLRVCLSLDIPIAAVNMGHVGFLAESDPAHMFEFADRILNGECEISTRGILSASLSEGADAMNDIVLTGRFPGKKVTKCDIYIDGRLYDRFEGDGVVISTPTGSTGYSLSAGGPIIAPELECMIVTPISSRKLGMRPLVINSSSRIGIRPVNDPAVYSVIADGWQEFEMPAEGFDIDYCKKIRYYRSGTGNFFDDLKHKLTEDRKC